MSRLEQLTAALEAVCGDRLASLTTAQEQITAVVPAEHWVSVATSLRDAPELRFEQLIDLCGVDYSAYGRPDSPVIAAGKRYAIVAQLLSVSHNWRVRVRVFAPDDEFPTLDSVTGVWPSVNWFEREAFDLFGIVFTGHADLRRILTDYGFVGHPFRKDFPISGNVEMRYDPDQQRVIYQPVTIEPREITPRIVREENYGDSDAERGGARP
jgi:NADH-quinone oxidoreductase subunit C